MDSTKITVTMIDTAVTHGLKEMTDDPKRTIRKLADMGRQFSTGRFQPYIFEIIQNLLEKEDSPYYSLLQSFLAHTDQKNAKKFGINMGYYSWTYYARILRQRSEELDCTIPWVISFNLDTRFIDDPDDRYISIPRIKELILEARNYGINTFSFSLHGGLTPGKNIFSLFEEFEECAFFLFLGNSQITVAQQDKLKKCGNTLLVIDCSSEDAVDTCEALNSSGNLYSIYYNYKNEEISLLEKRSFYDALSIFPSNMLFLVSDDNSYEKVGPIVKDIRMEQKCPYFLWEQKYDTLKISSIICDNEIFMSIDSEGNVTDPQNLSINLKNESNNLINVFNKIKHLNDH